jgi:hypothetical protein
MDAFYAGDASGRFWPTIGSAIAGLARRAGCSASACPLPEVREAARDMRRPLPDTGKQRDERRLAA